MGEAKYDLEVESKPIDEQLDSFLLDIVGYNPNADFDMIKNAYLYSKQIHGSQKRLSGEEYFSHPLAVSKILIRLHSDSQTIAAALLHDVMEDCGITKDELEKRFGLEVAELVEGLTKISGITFSSKEEYNAENVRKVLIATAKDVRVMIIKLADRLHNMRTLKVFSDEKRKRISQETMDIYAPIANKLGMYALKGELEDLAFKYLNPESYLAIKSRINEKREERVIQTRKIINNIRELLVSTGLNPEIYGRAKYFYSIFQKMKKKGRDFSEIYDLVGIRILVDSKEECYHALGVIHENFKPIPGKFKDYLSVPKPNGYQSLHTLVMGKHGKILELQIRTHEMHAFCEEGLAAHWRYKNNQKDAKFDRKLSWLKQILEWQRQDASAIHFMESLKIDLFQNEIIVFTPKGDPINLPKDGTPIDFAYEIHTNVGNHCSKALVNDKIVTLDHVLKSGDVVNVIIANNAKPSRNWLSFAKSQKARSKIRSYLHIQAADFVPQKIKEGEHEPHDSINLLSRIEVSDKKAPLKFSKCCSPDFGDKIAAYYTKDKKITVHKDDCPNIHSIIDGKKVDVHWKESAPKAILRITVRDRVGILADILKILSQMKILVSSVSTKANKSNVTIRFGVSAENAELVQKIIEKVKKIDNVLDISVEAEN